MRACLLAMLLFALAACEADVQLGSLPPLPDAGACDEDLDSDCDEDEPGEDEPDEDEDELDEDEPDEDDHDEDPDHDPNHDDWPGGDGEDCPDGDESC